MANLNTLYKKYSKKFDLALNYTQKTGQGMIMPYKYNKSAFENAYRQAEERLRLDLENAGRYDVEPSQEAIVKKVIEIQKYGTVSKKQAKHLQKIMQERGIDLTLNEAKRGITLSSDIYDVKPVTEGEKAVSAFAKEQLEYNTALKAKGYDSFERARIIGQVFHGSP